jgi:signal transduction histidine kinase
VSLRTRILLAFAAIVLIPIALLAFGVRQEMTRRLSDEYQARVNTVVEVVREDLMLEGDAISARLASLETALLNDTQFRLAITGLETGKTYLSNYARSAMGLTGLSLLRLQDGDGRILSSAPERDVLALARTESFAIGDQTFTLTGGVEVDDRFLARLARDPDIRVSLLVGEMSVVRLKADTTDAEVRELQVPLIRIRTGVPTETVHARLRVIQPLTPLRALVRSADSWFLATAAGTSLTALVLAVWVSSRISRPLAALAEKTAVLDLDRLDIEFDAGTDEVGTLSRMLGELTGRLRTSTTRVREAERRATVGDLARQVNHDIKNGLIPLRNVIRHLSQVQQEDPSALASVYAERRQTVDSSIAYLETLATSYARLSAPSNRRNCDLNALVSEVVRATQAHEHVDVRTQLAPNLPRVVGDPIAFRRILDNLTANAVDSLEAKPGRVMLSTEAIQRDGEPAVRVTVADTGRGMSPDEAGKIFNDFYTTKEGGSGLGLSIVRRLVMDLSGTIAVESTPGQGTHVIIEIPAVTSQASSG